MTTATQSKTILIAEDQDVLRKLLALVLTQQGYTVLQALGGVHAVMIAEEYVSDIHLLITDIVMPDLTGREVAIQILEKRPDTQVLYMSGHDQRVLKEIPLDPRFVLLRKPLDLHSLTLQVQLLIGS
ncbi:MAG: hypothetical protein C4293_21890 [Nitrospiraceae bacterium]